MRKICVITGSRADYGLLRWLMADIRACPETELCILATGSHLSARFGRTVQEMVDDGFAPDATLELDDGGDDAPAMTRAVGQAITEAAALYATLSPDICVVLGDRFEIFALAAAAVLMGLPLAHIHGGELSHGAIDDSLRHAITKLAHLHFTAAPSYRRRVLQMGETRVFDVGALGVDAVKRAKLPGRAALEAELGLDLSGEVLLISYHPVTLADDPAAECDALLAALARFADLPMVITKPNADPGGRRIIAKLEAFAAAAPARVRLVASLGQTRYLGMMRLAAVLLGNSSSGLIEAPAMALPAVNIGPRQDGRLRSASVIDCAATPAAIEAALRRALTPAFRTTARTATPAYGGGDAARRILEVLAHHPLEQLRHKRFHDVAFELPEEG